MSEPFTPEELRLLDSAAYPLLKASAFKKLEQLLADTRDALLPAVEKQAAFFPAGTDLRTGKISKGENYLQLPWMVLDFPRLFDKEEVFAYRTLFWWSHGFTCTLHLQGGALEKLRPQLLLNAELLRKKNFFFGVHSDPWRHEVSADNYRAMDELGAEELRELIRARAFVKLMRRMDVKDWRELPGFAAETFGMLLRAAGA